MLLPFYNLPKLDIAKSVFRGILQTQTRPEVARFKYRSLTCELESDEFKRPCFGSLNKHSLKLHLNFDTVYWGFLYDPCFLSNNKYFFCSDADQLYIGALEL